MSRPVAVRYMTKEIHIEQTIVQAMELDGWRVLKYEENFSERKRKRTGEAGACDRLFIRYSRFDLIELPTGGYGVLKAPAAEVLWWEFKRVRAGRKKATHLEPEQVNWIAAERARGALVWVAGVDHPATIEGCAAHYLNSGLARRGELFVKLIGPGSNPRE